MIAILSPSGQHVRFITNLVLLIAGATIYVGVPLILLLLFFGRLIQRRN